MTSQADTEPEQTAARRRAQTAEFVRLLRLLSPEDKLILKGKLLAMFYPQAAAPRKLPPSN